MNIILHTIIWLISHQITSRYPYYYQIANYSRYKDDEVDKVRNNIDLAGLNSMAVGLP